MTGISSSVGLVSGINTGDIIDQLIALEARPVNRIKTRIAGLDTERTAWMTLSASILGLKSAATTLKTAATFKTRTVSTSDEAIMTATASSSAAVGTYQFTVRRLAQSQQLISAGMADSDESTVGAGTLSFDTGKGLVNPSTSLSFLNGQAGVSRGSIRITDRAGNAALVDLGEAATVQDVLDLINNQADASVTAEVADGVIVLHDTSGGAGSLSVAEVGQSRAAAGLGILGSVAGNTLTGTNVNTIAMNTSLDVLNDGLGVRRVANDDMRITLRDGTALTLNLYGTVVGNDETIDYTAHTVGDVIDAINTADGNGGKLVASISADGRGITLTDTTGGGGDLVVENLNASHAATDLGLAGTYSAAVVDGRDVIAKLNSVLSRSLGGTAGMTLGSISITDRAGNAAALDLSAAQSLSDIVEAINANGVASVQASLNATGTGILITDISGSTAGNLTIADVSGNMAATLGIAVDGAVSQVDGGNAQLQYISTETHLDKLPGGGTFPTGKFKITGSTGATVTVNIGTGVQTVGDAITAINAMSEDIGVTARINDSGTGIILEDANGGALTMKVTEYGGRTAAALGLLGEAGEGETFIDGSFHRTVEISATDTLEDVAEKINDANLNVTASIINDGSDSSPYRLILSSTVSGTAGRIIFDGGATSLSMSSVFDPQDALVYMGSPGAASPVVLTSSTNQLDDVVQGLTIDLKGTSADPVSLSVAADADGIVTQLKGFTDSFNSILDNFDSLTSYDPDTQKAGILFGESMVDVVRSRLFNMILQTVDVDGSYDSLTDVGFKLSTGNQISFDEDVFRKAFTDNPDDVIDLFSHAPDTIKVDATSKAVIADPDSYTGTMIDQNVDGTGGIGHIYEWMLDNLVDSYDGVITRVTGSLDDEKDLLNDRIDSLNDLLASKRSRLERQFAAMETALAQLQGQQNALSALSLISFDSSSSSSSSSGG